MSILSALKKNMPNFHDDPGKEQTPTGWALLEDALQWAEEHASGHTIETGSGWSTVILANKAAYHTVIDPSQKKLNRIKYYLDHHYPGVTDSVAWLPHPSVNVTNMLTATETRGEPFSFALVDGSHAFPTTFIDWFYLARNLRVGGYIMVDDLALWTGAILKEFMQAEPAWEQVWHGRNTVTFRLVKPFNADPHHTEQLFVKAKS